MGDIVEKFRNSIVFGNGISMLLSVLFRLRSGQLLFILPRHHAFFGIVEFRFFPAAANNSQERGYSLGIVIEE